MSSRDRSPVPYRLLACDIDETLVRFPNPPSPRVAEAIQQAVAHGVMVVLVTGRAFRRAQPVAQILGLATPIICNHGGSIRGGLDGQMIYRRTMPRALTTELVTWLQGQQVYNLVFDGDQVYHDCLTDEVVPDFQVYTRGEQCGWAHPPGGTPPPFFARDLRPHVPLETEVILSTSKSHDHLAEVYEHARARWSAQARVLFSHPFGMDTMPYSSKSEALSWLAEHSSVVQEEVMAVGDGSNDADMLSWAGLGVAMGNGTPEAQAAADVIAPPFDQDGLAWAVERYILRTRRRTDSG
jgi:Cof subfamily protein (haloacid dehalogenase superfamily)